MVVVEIAWEGWENSEVRSAILLDVTPLDWLIYREKKLGYKSDPSKSLGLRKENRGVIFLSRLFINIKLIHYSLAVRNRSKSEPQLLWDLYNRRLMVSQKFSNNIENEGIARSFFSSFLFLHNDSLLFFLISSRLNAISITKKRLR